MLPGRVRLQVVGLKDNRLLGQKLVEGLQKTTGIIRATATPRTSRVLVYYDPQGLRVNDIITLLGKMLAAPAAKLAPAGRAQGQAASLPARLAVQESASPARYEVTVAGLPAVWYRLTGAEVLARLGSSAEAGLSEAEVQQRQQVFGPNILAGPVRVSPWQLFKKQFQDLMVRVLVAASGLSFFLGRLRDAAFSLGVVTMNACLGVWQELKASSALTSLQQLAAPSALTTRDGQQRRLPASELVPGDIIYLRSGDRVPADARLIAATDLEVEEASLTGESVPVRKQVAPLTSVNLVAGDMVNMVFMGSSVTRGQGQAVVVSTGKATQMGQVAGLLQEGEQLTPLQASLGELGRLLAWGCLAVSGVVLAGGLLRGQGVLEMVMTGASLAVAAIPEGMPVVVALALAFGVQRMARCRVIVRKLPALETLGCTTVICSDKTGTLTSNEMTVRAIACGRARWQVNGEGYRPGGSFTRQGPAALTAEDDLRHFLTMAALCCDARLLPPDQRRLRWSVEGDPTEGALLVAAVKAGLDLQVLQASYARCQEVPFNPEDCCMTVLYRDGEGRHLLITKGAPEAILARCDRVRWQGQVLPLTPARHRFLVRQGEAMAGQALRVLAVAYREDGTAGAPLIFAGMAGMLDPPRTEAREAVARCLAAGIRLVMVTGDHPATAAAIARELGILRPGGLVVTGAELEGMSDTELERLVPAIQVYARTSPRHKLRIVRAWQQAGGVVAMTGDGVNDAPAVKAADIGLAMGKNGTDITRDAASLVITDDNFATIVNAVEEGRTIYANIRKAIRYLLGTNIGDVVITSGAILAGLPLPLLPVHLLWLNLVGDSLPALALIKDPPAPGIMRQQPRAQGHNFLAGGLGRQILTRGILIGLGGLALFTWRLWRTGSLAAARSLALASLLVSQLIHLFDCRLQDGSGWRPGYLANPYLLGAGALTAVISVATFNLPLLQGLLHTVPLKGGEWLLATAVAAVSGGAALALARPSLH
ncbi:MAG: P-type Ca2+ transporter type [Clostridia bacterium]|nr:P-type Ca2+ transporter type [Clostridia bacterium]